MNPFKRAGQVNIEPDAPLVPTTAFVHKSHVQEIHEKVIDLRVQNRVLREKVAKLERANPALLDVETVVPQLHAIRVYAVGIRTWYRDNEQAQQIATDILFMIEKVGKK